MYLEYFHKYTFVCLLVQCFDSLSNLFKTRFEATKVDKVVVFFGSSSLSIPHRKNS